MPEQRAGNTTGHVAGGNWGWLVQSFQVSETLRTGSVSPEGFPRGEAPTPRLQQQNEAEEKCHKKLSPHRQCLPLDFGGLNSLTESDLEQSQPKEKKDFEWTKQHKTQVFYPACCISWEIGADKGKCSLQLKCFILPFFLFFFLIWILKPIHFSFRKN